MDGLTSPPQGQREILQLANTQKGSLLCLGNQEHQDVVTAYPMRETLEKACISRTHGLGLEDGSTAAAHLSTYVASR